MATEVKTNPFQMALEQIDQCAKIMKLDPQITAILKTPDARTSCLPAGTYG